MYSLTKLFHLITLTNPEVKLYINVTTTTLLIRGRVKTIIAITRKGICLVREFIETFPDQRERKKIIRRIEDMANNGPHPSREQFRAVEDNLFELKCHQVRILGFFQIGDVMLLTHGCVKKKDDLDPQEILRAHKLLAEYQASLGGKGGGKK